MLCRRQAGCETAGVEPTPRLDASRPSNLRLVAFVLVVVGALAIGIGSVLTWVSAGFTQPQLAELTSVTKGLDTAEGKVALGCAAVALILVITSRLVSDTARAVLAGVMVIVGALATVVGSMFISSASTTYSPIDSESIIAKLAAQLGHSPDEVRAALATVSDQLGPYTNVGAGPWIVVAGGVMVAVGGVLTVRWAARLSADRAAADEDGTDALEADGGRIDEVPDGPEPSLD
jgi:Tryptophan-associated transmembrane protein (Trp_oprn_chp)